MSANASHLIWIDLEMTGLNPDHDRIIEIATIVTDSNLNVLAEGPVYALHQPDALLDGMDEWNTKQHNRSGLVERIKESCITENGGSSHAGIFKNMCRKVNRLCGKQCVARPALFALHAGIRKYFHYRMIDVSTLKELALRWAPKIYNGVKRNRDIWRSMIFVNLSRSCVITARHC